MRRAAFALALLAGTLVSVPLLPPEAAFGRSLAAIDWDKLAQMEQAGTDAFNRAGDTSLSRKQRNAAIVESYGLLKKVYAVLDAHCDANPDQIEALDQRMVNLNMMTFWLKKDAPMTLIGEMKAAARGGAPSSGPPRADPDPDPRPGPKPDPETDTEKDDESSGIGGSSRRGDKPKPPSPPTPDPGSDPTPDPPPSTDDEPSAPAPSPTPRAATSGTAAPSGSPADIARAHERAKPHDIGGAVERWLDVLMETTDTSSPDYVEALSRVSELSARLKDFYRKARNEDPDAVARNDQGGRESSIAAQISPGLSSDVASERRDAADQLASLGWTPAGLPIQSALRRERDDGVRDAMFLALVRLGGSRTCETLARFSKERNDALALGAVRSLSALSRKGPVEARYAAASLGTFVAKAKSKPAPKAALDVLRGMAGAGVPGLVSGIESKDRAIQLEILAAMKAAKDGRAGPPIAERLTEKVDDEMRRALMSAATAIGQPAVPALIEALKKKKTRRYCAIALYEITSQPFGEDAKEWQKWWREQSAD